MVPGVVAAAVVYGDDLKALARYAAAATEAMVSSTMAPSLYAG